LGIDAPLFNAPSSEVSISHIAEPVNVPEPLRRRPLYDELEALRQASVDGGLPTVPPTYFADLPASSDPAAGHVLRVFVADAEITPDLILICDLGDWTPPPDSKPYRPTSKARDDTSPDLTREIRVAVDPVLGRLAFPATSVPAADVTVRVDYAYGFPDNLGGGPYARTDIPQPTVPVETMLDLSNELTSLAGAGDKVIEIGNSATLVGNLVIALDPGQRVTIQAATGQRPVIDGNVTITASDEGRVTLDGLLISGRVLVNGPQTASVILRDSTLVPAAAPSLEWLALGAGRLLVLDRAITGRLRTGDGVQLDIRDSVIDAQDDAAFAIAASDDGVTEADRITIARSTVIGAVHVREIDLAEESIFTGVVTSERRQQGCLRFCYLPAGSHTPRQYRCQPGLAVREAIDAAKRDNPAISLPDQDAIADAVRSRVEPSFTTDEYGQPAYLQLDLDTPAEISGGAEDGAEMGVYHDLFQAQRESNLRARLDEYLRAGLEAGIFYAT
jgi:hypothetical protein